jgi:DNA polymerase III psi subunit
MTLRLNSSSRSSNEFFINAFEHDVNISSTTKHDVLKFLSIVVKNLIEQPTEPKYRQLRLQNSKIQRYTAHTPIMNYLQHVIGFERISESNTDGITESLLRIVDSSRLPSEEALNGELRTITLALQRAQCTNLAPVTQPRVISNSSSTSSLLSEETENTKLTEKQKARKLMEEASAMQKKQDEQARKRTIQQIQNDKHVRANDPNWKPSASAAATKSGDAMLTFRDKFGEG